MFSQFRNAVEQLEQLATNQISNTGKRPPNHSSASTSSQTSSINEMHRSPKNSIDESRRSMTSPTPSQLAESALSNFRKTLMASRSGSPAPPSHLPEKDHPQTHARPARTLEERLRASFVIGEASEKSSPQLSKVATPTAESEVDPVTVQLPHSPVLQAQGSPSESVPSENEVVPKELVPPEEESQHLEHATAATVTQVEEEPSVETSQDGNDSSNIKVDVSIERVASPDTLLEPATAVAKSFNDAPEGTLSNTPTVGVTEITDSESRNELTEESASNYQSLPVSPQYASSAEDTPEIEQLRERLKLVEQRFTG